MPSSRRPASAIAEPWNARLHSASCGKLVLAAERDDLVAERQRLGGLAAIQVNALHDDQREDERHRLALRSGERSVSRARRSARSG